MWKPWKDFCQAAFQPAGPQHVLVPGAVPPQGQDFTLPFAGPRAVPAGLFLQPPRVAFCVVHGMMCSLSACRSKGLRKDGNCVPWDLAPLLWSETEPAGRQRVTRQSQWWKVHYCWGFVQDLSQSWRMVLSTGRSQCWSPAW